MENLFSTAMGSFTFDVVHLYKALFVMFVALFIFYFIQQYVLARLNTWSAHTKNNVDDAVVAMVQSIKPPFYWLVAIYLGLLVFSLPSFTQMVLNEILLAIVLFYSIRAVGIAFNIYFAQTTAKGTERAAQGFLTTIVKAILWIIAVLLLLSNSGINITSLVAGLGIGGIAVAFALQNVLTDLFSSFAIYFDKPFVVGDFIIVGQNLGVVERIGIKTTRIRALQGEEIVISNRELTSVRVQNFRSMKGRRIATTIGIEYGTPRNVVARLAGEIHACIDKVDGVTADRVHFSGFGDSALTFDIVYFVLSGDYTEYMNRQQEINLSIMGLFEKENVSFAFPSQTVYVQSSVSSSKK